MERVVPRRWGQRGDQDEVHYVPQYDRQQSLEKIEEHWWFRHHRGRWRMPSIYADLLSFCKRLWESADPWFVWQTLGKYLESFVALELPLGSGYGYKSTSCSVRDESYQVGVRLHCELRRRSIERNRGRAF
jgi:hypothetical protein